MRNVGRKRLFTKTTAKLREWQDEADYRLSLHELLFDVINGKADDDHARRVALGILSEDVDLRDQSQVDLAKDELKKALKRGDTQFVGKIAEYVKYFNTLREKYETRRAEIVKQGPIKTVFCWNPDPTIEGWIIQKYMKHSPKWEPRPIDLVDSFESENFPETIDRKTIVRACQSMGLLFDSSPGR